MIKQYKLEKMDDSLQKLKKMVRIVLYGLAISQSDCREGSLYQLPLINTSINSFTMSEVARLILTPCLATESR